MLQRIMFAPLSIAGGIVGGVIAKKIFDQVWQRIDDADPPEPEHRLAGWGKMVAALAIQGAIFKAVRGVVDRGSRNAYAKLTGSWPGGDLPERA